MMHNLFLIWSLLLFVQICNLKKGVGISDISSDVCGIVNPTTLFEVIFDFETRVIEGYGIKIEQSPWTAILEIAKKKNQEQIEVHCGGSLISPKFITTAAHCVWRNNHAYTFCPEKIRSMKTQNECHSQKRGCPPGCLRLRPEDLNIYLGETNVLVDNREALSVKEIYIHPLWDKSARLDKDSILGGHDAAILQLIIPQIFNDKIKPICLPLPSLTELADSTNVTIDGFGSVKPGSPPSVRLQRGEMQIITKVECSSLYNFTEYNHFCAAGPDGIDSCNGDSGSGLTTVIERGGGQSNVHLLIGITSFGPRNCGSRAGVYTNVISHMDWIEEIISKSGTEWGPCSTTCGLGVQRRLSQEELSQDNSDFLIDLRNTEEIRECFQEACSEDITKALQDEQCTTVGGSKTGAPCVFPFIFKCKTYTACTLDGANDRVPWCSTRVDSDGVHVKTNWGHCGNGCLRDFGGVLLVGGFVDERSPKQSNHVLLHNCHFNSAQISEVPAYPLNISSAVGSVLDDTVYICGGFYGNFQTQKQCYTLVFQPGEEWRKGPTLKTPRGNAAMVLTRNGLWISGGRHGSIDFLSSTEFFNKSLSKWTEGPSLTRELGSHCAVALGMSTSTELIEDIGARSSSQLTNDHVIIIGGLWYDDRSDDYVRTAVVEMYNILTGAVTILPTLNTARSSHSCVLLPGNNDNTYKILVAGGKSSKRQRLSNVELFEPGASRWISLSPLPSAISGAALILQNSIPFLIGGITSTDQTNNSTRKFSHEVFSYDAARNTWKEFGKIKVAVAFPVAIALPENICHKRSITVGEYETCLHHLKVDIDDDFNFDDDYDTRNI